ncbi:unnamed protein product [Rotaria magnacalcarata]|uniref:Myb-like domain-containing protein n=7 Tax=Rotaria magnacalcarata TaxID=392030 RepID=A0A814F743_9BILA|nr:unnamed protein product [Rotaria magnacalcarata]CAF1665930.1 unnamed protein product [Rotaria magnacalcarata]
MNETIEENKVELPPPIPNVIEDSIASRTKEITKRPKRERSPTHQIQPSAPKIKKIKEVAPKLSDKTKWTMEEQKQFFSALRIYGKNFDALGQCFNTRRRLVNPEAQKRTFGQIRCFYYRSFRTVSKLCTFTEEEKVNVDSLELRSVLAYLCLKPKVKCFDKKPTISVLHQLIRNGSAFLRVKGQREHVSIIGKALKPPKTSNTLGTTKQSDRTLSKHIRILLSPASPNAYMRVALSCRYPHVEVLVSRTTTLYELIDRLTQYWQLNNHAQSLFKDDLSMEQLFLYPHGSYLSSSFIDLPSVSTDSNPVLDLASSRKQSIANTDKQFRSRCDSEISTDPVVDPSLTLQSNAILKRNNLSENEFPNESTGISISPSLTPTPTPSVSFPSSPSSTSIVTINNKSNLVRTAILLAAKRAVSNNPTNNYDTSTFTLNDGTEDEADSSSTPFKQRFDFLDLIDELPSEDEIESDANTSVPVSITATSSAVPMNNSAVVTLTDISQGISRTNSLFSTLTIGELQKLLQRTKELRLNYDFTSLLRTSNATDCVSPAYFLHYVIQTANQCLTTMADRQSQSEIKTTKKPNTKKQQISKSKCFCSCCSHQHSLSTKEPRRSSVKAANSPNTEMCALLPMSQSISTQDMIISAHDDIFTMTNSLQNNMNNNISKVSDGDSHNKSFTLTQNDEQSDIFDTRSWPIDTGRRSLEQNQPPASSTATAPVNTTTEVPSVLTLLLPMMNGTEPTSVPQTKQSSIIFSSNNGVIDDPLIQSLAAEQAASAHNYDLLSHRYKRVRRPLRYGDQSTRPSNIQLLINANINAQQTAAANQRLLYNTNNTPDLTVSSNDVFHNDCENSSNIFEKTFQNFSSFSIEDDLLNDNTNMSTVSLSTTIVNAALQSNTSRLRLDWPDNMSDLSFGSFPDLLESNTLSSTPGELSNFEQSTVTDINEQNKCVFENSISDAVFAINNTTN